MRRCIGTVLLRRSHAASPCSEPAHSSAWMDGSTTHMNDGSPRLHHVGTKKTHERCTSGHHAGRVHSGDGAAVRPCQDNTDHTHRTRHAFHCKRSILPHPKSLQHSSDGSAHRPALTGTMPRRVASVTLKPSLVKARLRGCVRPSPAAGRARKAFLEAAEHCLNVWLRRNERVRKEAKAQSSRRFDESGSSRNGLDGEP